MLDVKVSRKSYNGCIIDDFKKINVSDSMKM